MKNTLGPPLTASICAAVAAAWLTAGNASAAPRDATLVTATQVRERALADDTALELLTSLTTEVGPRLAGSPGDLAAVDWARRNFTRLGFASVRTSEVIVPHWVRGDASFAIVSPFPQAMPTLAIGGSIGTPDDGIEADILAVPDVAALLALPAGAATGRIVYFSGRTERTRDGSGYGRAVRSRTDGASAAASRGAVGVVIRSISTSSNRFPHTGTLVYNIANPRIPAVAISNPDADALERQLGGGKPVRVRMQVTARDLPQTRSANVIGEIPGTDPEAGVVLLGAHLDSWDVGQGAVDDGAGVAIVMAAARQLAAVEPRPRRTIRVVLFANEEFGLSGAGAYAGDAGTDVARHALAMEADTGGGPVWKLGGLFPDSAWPLVKKIHRVVAPLGVELGKNDYANGADLGPLRRRGVPILSLVLDASQYFDVHHTANDTLDKVDPKSLRQSVAVFAVAAYLAAAEPAAIDRIPIAAPPR
jgi:carboxypeptidase Q